MARDFQILIPELSLAGFIVGHPFDGQCRNPDVCSIFTSKNVELLIKPLKLPPYFVKDNNSQVCCCWNTSVNLQFSLFLWFKPFKYLDKDKASRHGYVLQTER
ncbi:hypothetical protein SDJN03_23951, partial [Cucurbita argyrosperma subsp. sororia]